jgi:diguanylate cyclase (GGDEF)-like protein
VTARSAWKAWLLPGGALLAGTVALVNSPWMPRLAPSLDFYYFAVFASGLLLAWRFNSSRVLFSLLTLLLAHRAVEFFSAGEIRGGPGRGAVIIVGVLVPLNSVAFAYMRERGLTIPGVTPRFGLLFLESVFTAVLCRPESSALFPPARTWILPGWVLVWLIGAAIVLVVRFLYVRKPVEIGFLWSLAAVFLWLRSLLGLAAEAYVATAGLVLAVALIETSYVLAYHDELTGVPSRRAFNEALLALDQQYAIAIVDIDHFKKFNDTYGHDVGDQVLRMVASRLAAGNSGQAYRCGGEEFAIIFRNTSARDAAEKLESLRELIQNSSFRVRGLERRKLSRLGEADRRAATRKKAFGPVSVPAGVASARAESVADLSVTVSIGVAEPGTRYRQPEQVIRAADQALYNAKRNGRNRVEMASAPQKRARRTKIARG